jgi:hypothetical protein
VQGAGHGVGQGDQQIEDSRQDTAAVFKRLQEDQRRRGNCWKLTSSVVSNVPDRRSRDLEVVVVRRTINLSAGNLKWGGNGRGLRKGRSVYE